MEKSKLWKWQCENTTAKKTFVSGLWETKTSLTLSCDSSSLVSVNKKILVIISWFVMTPKC